MVRRCARRSSGGRGAGKDYEPALVPFKRRGEAEVNGYFGAKEVYGGAGVQHRCREGVTRRFAPEVSTGSVPSSVSMRIPAKERENTCRALRVKFPSHGGTSTLAGVLKYLNEELSGGMAGRLL